MAISRLAGRNSGFWTNLPVPSCWDTKGFGSYEFGNDDTSESGEYRHHFIVPIAWTNQRVFLGFEGAMTDTETRLNGQLLEYVPLRPVPTIHQGGFYEFSYEVTDNLIYGTSNRLEVTVRKQSANTSINQAERQADYWTFGGIYRPVYLEARPREFIERIATDARADGQITVHAFFSGYRGQLYWAQLDTTQANITVATRTSDLFFSRAHAARRFHESTGRESGISGGESFLPSRD